MNFQFSIFKQEITKISKCKGFTFIELLVVAGIVIFFTGLMLANYKEGGQQFALQRSANKLAQDIRRVEVMAMSMKVCGAEICGVEKIPQGGYGIYLQQGDDYYLLYADTSPADGNEKYDPGSDNIVETIHLEKTYIKDLSAIFVNINFKPPDPKVRILPDPPTDIVIILALRDDVNQEKKVTVNDAGLVGIE